MSSEKVKIQPVLFAVPDPAEEVLSETSPKKSASRAEVNSTADAVSSTAQVAHEQSNACQFCFGSGMEVVPGKGARQCRCRTQNAQTRLLAAARIPRRYTECSLQNFYPKNDTQFKAFHYARCLERDYPGVERGLLLMGTVGVGKTHLSVAVLRALLSKGVGCLFYDFGSLLKQIQDSYNPISKTSELSVLAPVYQAEILVLDELGASKPTDWVRETMMQVIGKRYNDKRLTIFTTNYLDARRAPTDETLEDRIGVRLRSRLYEMCKTVVVEGEDYRRRRDAQQV